MIFSRQVPGLTKLFVSKSLITGQKGVVTNLAGSDLEGELALTDNWDQGMQVS